jgi:hypothetical protein
VQMGVGLRASTGKYIRMYLEVYSDRYMVCHGEHHEGLLVIVSEVGSECTFQCNQKCTADCIWECVMK